MSKIKALAAAVLCAFLSACGGGGSGNAGTSPFFPARDVHDEQVAAPAPAADIVLELSKATLGNGGSDSVAITVTALNA